MKQKVLFTIFTSAVLVITGCSKEDNDQKLDQLWGSYSGTIKTFKGSADNSKDAKELYNVNNWPSEYAKINIIKLTDSTLTIECTSSMKSFSNEYKYKFKEGEIIAEIEGYNYYETFTINDTQLSYKVANYLVNVSYYTGKYSAYFNGTQITAYHD